MALYSAQSLYQTEFEKACWTAYSAGFSFQHFKNFKDFTAQKNTGCAFYCLQLTAILIFLFFLPPVFNCNPGDMLFSCIINDKPSVALSRSTTEDHQVPIYGIHNNEICRSDNCYFSALFILQNP